MSIWSVLYENIFIHMNFRVYMPFMYVNVFFPDLSLTIIVVNTLIVTLTL